jgi:hypothetical protein
MHFIPSPDPSRLSVATYPLSHHNKHYEQSTRLTHQPNLLHDNTILIILLLISRQLALLHIPALATLTQLLQPRNSLWELES